MKHDLALINGKVFYAEELQERNVYITQGKIAQIKNSELEAEEKIDCKGMLVLPGMIDSHVHMREPGLTHREDFLTGSMAAAHGGVTTFLDMPNTKPPTLTIANLEEKRELAKKSVVNYGFHFGSSQDNLDEIAAAWDKNIASVKVFMNHTTGEMLIEEDEVIEKIADASRRMTVHAEGKKVKKILELTKGKKTKVYLCHISLKEELDLIKKEHVKPFVEVTPHHLFLTSKDIENPLREMYPSLKSEKDQEALWTSIKAGIVTTIGSDHAPHTKEEKMTECTPRGVPNLDTTIPLLLDAVNKGKLTITKLVELCSENPAKIFGIKEKGSIAKGYDADLVVVDLKKEHVVNADDLFTKCGWSPYEGFKLKGKVEKTLVNGKVVCEGNEVYQKTRGREVFLDVN